MAAVQVDEGGKFGFINKKGELVIKPQFAIAHKFSEGLASVRKEEGGKMGFIDREGNFVIEPQFDWIELGFFEGLAAVQKERGGKWGYIKNPLKSAK